MAASPSIWYKHLCGAPFLLQHDTDSTRIPLLEHVLTAQMPFLKLQLEFVVSFQQLYQRPCHQGNRGTNLRNW